MSGQKEDAVVAVIVLGSLGIALSLFATVYFIHRLSQQLALSFKLFGLITVFSVFRIVHFMLFSAYGIVRGINPLLWIYPNVALLMSLGSVALRYQKYLNLHVLLTILLFVILIAVFGGIEVFVVWILTVNMNLTAPAFSYTSGYQTFASAAVLAVGIVSCSIAFLLVLCRPILIYYVKRIREEPPMETYSLMSGATGRCMSSLDISSVLLMCPVLALTMYYAVDVITLTWYILLILDTILAVIYGVAIKNHLNSDRNDTQHEIL